MKDHIIIKIMKPEDYEDVHDELVLADFLENPNAFNIDLIDIRPDPVVLELVAHVKEYFNFNCRESGTSQLCGECIGCRMKKIIHALPEEYK